MIIICDVQEKWKLLPELGIGDIASLPWEHHGEVELNKRYGNCHRNHHIRVDDPHHYHCHIRDRHTNPPAKRK